VKPTLQALLVADHVYTDKTTGKKIIAGVFHRIWFAKPKTIERSEEGKIEIKVPPGGMQAGSPFCYISLTEVRGSQKFTLRYVHLNEDKSIFSGEFQVNGSSPIETLEVVVPLPPLVAAQAGVFALELLWNDEPLGSHRISFVEIPDHQKDDDDHERDN
jgi:hypothetical protein